jgi:hypothetical protein
VQANRCKRQSLVHACFLTVGPSKLRVLRWECYRTGWHAPTLSRFCWLPCVGAKAPSGLRVISPRRRTSFDALDRLPGDPIGPIRGVNASRSWDRRLDANDERKAWPRVHCGLAAYNFGIIASTCMVASLTPSAGWRSETSGHMFVTIIFARQPAAGRGDERIAQGIGSCRNWSSRSS